jgi:urease accessory protein
MRQTPFCLAIAFSALFGSARLAWAHPGHGGHDFLDGAVHPIFGLDHLLAMVAVGLLALRIGGRGLWFVPGAFILGTLAGGALAMAGLPLPGVQQAILTSVLVFGLLISATSVVPLRYAAPAVGAFALFHGYAHAAESIGESSFAPYAFGFLVSTAFLHVAGIAAGFILTRSIDVKAVRWAGGLISVLGVVLIFGLV